jgi:hypothetical protein
LPSGSGIAHEDPTGWDLANTIDIPIIRPIQEARRYCALGTLAKHFQGEVPENLN